MTAVVAAVFARGGSKGVPRKNLREVGGVSLVGRAVRSALACPGVVRVVLSTDDEQIAEEAARHGADVPFLRPAELSSDDASEWLSWQHAVRWLEADGQAMDAFLVVPPTAPLRAPEDLAACVRRLVETDADLVLTVTPARRHPAYNMVEMDAHGRVALLMEGGHVARQAVSPAYDVTTVAYATTPDHVLRAAGVLDGVVLAVEVPTWRALDIDDAFDLHLARLLHDRPFEDQTP